MNAHRAIALLGLTLTILSPLRASAQPCEPRIARAVSVQGTVEVRRNGESEFRALALNDELCPGDTVRAGANSRADVALLDQSVMRIRAGTELTLTGVRNDQTSLVEMLRGTAHFLTRGGARSLEVETPFSVAGVRGTEFQVEVDADQTLVSVLEGNVHTSNAAGELAVASGQAALARQGEPPRPQLIAQPRDAVRWALYYPPVLYVQPGARSGDPAWLEQTRRSSEAALRGDLAQAFERIEGVTGSDASDPGFLTYRASLRLPVR